jgi:C-terminal processing protease CtpA/Prc
MAPRVQMWQNNSDASKQAMERGLAQFKQAMEKVKDNPEAKAEIEKAMKAFEKGMAEAMKAMPKSVEGFNLQEFKAPLAVQGFDMPQGAMMFAPARSGAGGEGRLGITIEPIGPGMAEQLDLPKGVGIVVSSVLDGTPAAKAGMKKGDIVLEFAGKPVPGEPGDVVKLIGQVKKDEKVNVIILRKGKKETLKDVTLPEAKAKVRVLEALPENFQFNGPGIQAFEFQAKNAEDLQREMARVQQEIEKLGGQGGAVKNQSLSVQVNDDVVTINADRDGVKYALTGATDGTFSSIVVKDGDETIKAKSIDELPTKHKEAVQSMLKNVRFKK